MRGEEGSGREILRRKKGNQAVGLKPIKRKIRRNRSPKGNTWSAIPVALLCLVVNWNERQGSGPEGDEVL